MNEIKIDQILRSKRKTIALMISQEGQLIVKAPFFTPLFFIKRLISKKRNWILKKQNQIKTMMNFTKPKKFIDGEEFFYLGKKYKLYISDIENIVLKDKLFFPKNNLKNPTEYIVLWYQNEALGMIKKRVDIYSKLMGVKYKAVKISNAKTRWGSCSSTNSLNFSWKLIMAPLVMIDYVVVHELVHIKHKDHSSKFWDEVKKYIVDYKEKRKWFRDNKYIFVI